MILVSEHPASQFVGTALLFCREQRAISVISESLRPLAIRLETCDQALSALRILKRQKFEAVIVDLQLGEQAQLFRQQLQASPSNRTSVTFSITPEWNLDAKLDSTFVLHRPLTVESVSPTMKAAFGMVIRERRRYFRCPVVAPAVVYAHLDDQKGVMCQTVNLSEGGVAINFRTERPKTAEGIQFSLPGCRREFFVKTRICWQYPSGVIGLEFKWFPITHKAELQDWLARKLEQTLPASVGEINIC
jgi:hypothetical protein